MNRPTVVALLGSILIAVSTSGFAQNGRRAPAIASSDVLSQISMFSYREGKKSTLNFRGTPIAANAYGDATVKYGDGNAEISASFDDLPAPGTLGPYTTYVLWALTPDGHAVNQGVIGGYEGGKGEIKTGYGASQFALIVTAEPHFAVSAPSTMIALYNVADEVEGTESKVTSLTERFDYSALKPIAIDEEKSPAAIVQAKYAVAIAESVTEYSSLSEENHDRQAEQRAIQHLGFVAHELRNALNTAMLAFDAIHWSLSGVLYGRILED